MYSYADRLRAVELYIRLGKRLNATIRQLGYPTKNALKGWYSEYVQHLDLRTQPVARAPKFSEAQKQAALEHYRTHDRCIVFDDEGAWLPWSRNSNRMGQGGFSGGAFIHGWSILAPWLL